MARLTTGLAAGRLLVGGGRDVGGRPRRRWLALESGGQVLDLGGQIADHSFQLGHASLQALTPRAAGRFVHADDATKPRPLQLRQFSTGLVNGYGESTERQVDASAGSSS